VTIIPYLFDNQGHHFPSFVLDTTFADVCLMSLLSRYKTAASFNPETRFLLTVLRMVFDRLLMLDYNMD
jgi:hypothetical protein